MPSPSQYVRVKRTATYVAKKTTVSFKAKKTTKKYRKGQRVSKSYAERFPRLVVKTGYKKGAKVSAEYAKKHPQSVQPTEWMSIEERKVQFDPFLKKQTYGDWKVTSKQKMEFYEKILPIKNLSSRSVSMVLARNHVYHNIWQNDKGVIRISINGIAEERRVKEVIHLGYLKSVWYNKHNGYSQFKNYLLHKILLGLRRRGLRLSNSKESMQRIVNLRKELNMAVDKLRYVSDHMYDSTLSKVKELRKLIRLQKSSRQATHATIRIEKLVP